MTNYFTDLSENIQLGKILENIKNFDNFRWALLFVIPISIALLIFLICTHSLILPEWFLDLIQIPALLGNLFSGSTYIARIIDAFTTRKGKLSTAFNLSAPAPRTVSLGEKIGTLLGLVAGLAVSITLICLKETIPLLKPLHAVADIIFVVNSIGSFAGLGNRLGCCIQSSRMKNERIAMSIAAVAAIAIGIALFVTGAAVMVSIMGVTSFFTGGLALPIWITGIIFVASFTSSIVSCTDYTTKAYNYIRFASGNGDKQLNNHLANKRHEYRGAMIGVGIGLVIGGIILTALLITQPHIFVGIVGLVIAAIVISSSMGLMGGVSSRIGRFIDGFVPASIPVSSETEHKKEEDKRLIAEAAHEKTKGKRPTIMPHVVKSPMPEVVSEAESPGNLLSDLGIFKQLRPASPEPLDCHRHEKSLSEPSYAEQHWSARICNAA